MENLLDDIAQEMIFKANRRLFKQKILVLGAVLAVFGSALIYIDKRVLVASIGFNWIVINLLSRHWRKKYPIK